MSSATMVLQPPSPSADFINDMEQDCDYMLDEFDSAMGESTEPVAELIFDWDDTLLPSTWLASQGFRLDFPAELPQDIILALSEHDQHVYKVLQKAMTFGNVVIITNAEKIVLTGKKFDQKTLRRYSGFPGGQRVETYRTVIEKNPERVVRQAIVRMLPSGRLGREMESRLKIYVGEDHPHTSQNPEAVETSAS